MKGIFFEKIVEIGENSCKYKFNYTHFVQNYSKSNFQMCLKLKAFRFILKFSYSYTQM